MKCNTFPIFPKMLYFILIIGMAHRKCRLIKHNSSFPTFELGTFYIVIVIHFKVEKRQVKLWDLFCLEKQCPECY